MKNVRIKNTSAKPFNVTGHRELKPGEEREVPENVAQYLASVPKDENGKGIEIVKSEAPADRAPRSKSEERRIAIQRGDK